ncbi:hypothetical protein L5515_011888 [Caenorhabditis briggsae]|uniref:ShKT domain-containing protein n=1 Tax=Caenorhabditis briggsae TaxID=6238 RepID=A0AAE9EVL1_CAEBR|nr:hypothetical protein L5515_011888 [Caenorhabditis briggsae]
MILFLPIWFLYLLKLISASVSSGSCQDKSPYCNPNDCNVRPGYAMVYCRKTCGNCIEFCEDSKFITCSSERKKDCDDMLSDYCPKLCGKCYSKVKSDMKRIKTIPVTQFFKNPATTSTTTTTRSPSIRLKQPRMLPNGTFISPPLPKYEKLDDTTFTIPEHPTVIEYPMAHMEELIPEPQRIWPEPEPMRIQPISVYSPYAFVPLQHHTPQHYNPWSQQLGLTSSLDTSRRAPQNYYSSYNQYPQYPDEKINSITPSNPPASSSFENPMQLVEPFLAPGQPDLNPKSVSSLINLLGCKDKDEIICKHVTADTCLSRPGYYLKLCPVTCKNCSGYQCIDSIKIDCEEVKAQGACKLSVASEYCPRTCEYCNPPSEMAQSMSDCKDELDTCEQLAESGACQHDFSKSALRLYCAKSCGFCKIPQFYFSDSPLMASVVSTRKLLKNSMNRRDRFLG